MKLFLIIITVAFSFLTNENRIKTFIKFPSVAIGSPKLKATGSHTIGEHYGGGVVFYVDNTGQHGLIAATSDQKKAKWYNGNYILTNASGTAIGTGQTNTTAIVTVQGTGTYAAIECDQLELDGFSDWFLPSKDELNLMFKQKYKIGGFSNPYYWSSSENSPLYAWAQNFNNGFQDYGNKNSAPSVRAVRAF